MSQVEKVEVKNDEEELTITRVFDVPRDLVWKAWTDPELFMQWWGPSSFTSPYCKIDLRVGGKFLVCMRSPEGKDYWTTGIYREIAPPSLLVMTNSFSDENGRIVSSETYGLSPGIAKEMVINVRLQEIDGKKRTRQILTHSGISKMSPEERHNAELGWVGSLEKMAVALGKTQPPRSVGSSGSFKPAAPRTTFVAAPGKQEVMITREFDAPRELVFKAFTDPSLYVKWLGPRGYTMKLEKFEPKSGGSWRYTHKNPEGMEFGFHGVYHEVHSPDLLIDTFEFEGLPERGHVSLETAKFEELPNDRTKLTIHSVFLSVADRDGQVSSGMEAGLNDSLDRLSELLAEKSSKKRKKAFPERLIKPGEV
jgi:uncharacterized protein YndB with AHSA1/START domain